MSTSSTKLAAAINENYQVKSIISSIPVQCGAFNFECHSYVTQDNYTLDHLSSLCAGGEDARAGDFKHQLGDLVIRDSIRGNTMAGHCEEEELE